MTDISGNDADTRAGNREIFETMIGHLGRQEFDECAACLAEDVLCEWPYVPMPDLPDTMRGRSTMRDFFREGMSQFDPYNYRITRVYDLTDPNLLIAEYYSQSRHRGNGRPYGNQYLSIFRFESGLINYWKEYLNPLPIYETMGLGFPGDT